MWVLLSSEGALGKLLTSYPVEAGGRWGPPWSEPDTEAQFHGCTRRRGSRIAHPWSAAPMALVSAALWILPVPGNPWR